MTVENAAQAEPLPGPDPPPPSPPFPIVGIAGSAGGLEAFTELLAGLPQEPGLALLFVLHLEPTHKSELPSILGRATRLTVREAAHGLKVEPDHVYLIPPTTNIALTDGHLALTPRPVGRGVNMPADHLFRSLASTLRGRSIGVILSGGGTDGTLGFQAIKAQEGITFAQDERTARQASMPRSAVADGNVDYVLPPAEIGRQLVRLAGHPYVRQADHPPAPAPAADTVEQILHLLRLRTAVDFTGYKQTTIRRRIRRRMALRGLEDASAYLSVLREDAAELHALYQDFLIRVTQFFRDPAAFEALKEVVFPRLIVGRSADTPVRVWVAGCATGEEVYSLAIALLEYQAETSHNLPIKILATDLSESALERARAGLYLDNIEIDVSAERLRRFFVRVNSLYQVGKAVRDLCVFARHNMVADPPFSRIDLVSCRNVLIYMDASLQKRLLPVLHYALNPHGFLFLGESENIGSHADLFEVVDGKHRIFARGAGPSPVPLGFSGAAATEGLFRHPRPGGDGTGVWSALDVQREADRVVLARYAPVGVVVDETGTVVQFRGRTSSYLEPAPGMASLDLMRMLREGLLADVRAAFHQARTDNQPASRDGIRLGEKGESRLVKVEVVPIKVPPSGARFFLVLFRELPPPAAGGSPAAEARPEADAQRLAQMQQEMASLREYLQSIIEERESTNEELRSANEEIMSANEELQSTNEELQTAKEEAQSANEELATVNEELQYRNAELARAHNDLINLFSGVNIAILMVNRELCVRRFTPQAEKLFNLIPADVGRPIGNLNPNLDVPDLTRLIAGVIDTLTPYEGEVQDRQGHWHLLRIRPYVTLDNKIDGASIVLLDIDSVKRKD